MPSFYHFAPKSLDRNSFSWLTLSIFSVALPHPVHLIRESGGHGGKLDPSVFSWLTGKNLSLPVPVEKERIVECRPWQSIPCVLMVGLSWTAGFSTDIYTQLTQLPESGRSRKGELSLEKKMETAIKWCLKFKTKKCMFFYFNKKICLSELLWSISLFRDSCWLLDMR